MQIILLGMGVQSTCLYLKSSLGQLPKADCAIFCDIGREGTKTYQYLDYLLQWQRDNNGIPIHVIRTKNLFDNLLQQPGQGRFTTIPAFTKNPDGGTGMLKRQCTAEYKIQPVDDYIRDRIYCLPKNSRRPVTTLWYGISTDEAERASIPSQRWKLNTFPFLGIQVNSHGGIGQLDWGQRLSRKEIEQWYGMHGFPVPPKSSCVFCPYQTDSAWAHKRKNEPEDFADAVLIDEAIRNSTARGINNPIFLHRSCRPLKEVQFESKSNDNWGECSGHCHL